MPMFRFELDTVSSTFVKIPGLLVAVNHDEPMLFKLHFSGGCYMTRFINSYIHFMINDLILIDNTLFPNTATRNRYAPRFGHDLMNFDSHGASFMRSSNSDGSFYACTKYELVYLPPNTDVIEVVVRTDHASLYIHAGTFIVEALQYAPNAKINFQYPKEYFNLQPVG